MEDMHKNPRWFDEHLAQQAALYERNRKLEIERKAYWDAILANRAQTTTATKH